MNSHFQTKTNPTRNRKTSMKTNLINSTSSSRIILTATIAALLTTHSAFAANATWNGTTDAVWATGTNWSTTPVPGSGDTATFNNAGGGNTSIDIGAGGVTLQNLLFDTASAAAYTIGSGAQTLTLNNAGAITMNSTVASAELINAGLILGTDGTTQTFTLTNQSTTAGLTFAGDIFGSSGADTKTLAVAGAGNTDISGNINDGGAGSMVSLTKTGTGTLTLAPFGSNNYSGPTTINGGILSIGRYALGSGNLNIAGGTLRSDAPYIELFTQNIAIGTGGATFEVNGPDELILYFASITGGTGNALTKTGTGTLTLGALTNTYQGPTIIKGGSLLLAGNLYDTARVEVQSGATLGGYGTIQPTGDIELLAGGKLSPGGGQYADGTLTVFFGTGQFDISLGVAATASHALLFDLGTPGGLHASDQVGVFGGALDIGTGGLAFDDFVFTALSGFGAGTYTLFEGNYSIVGSFDSNAAHLTGSIGGYLGTLGFADSGRDVVLTVTPEPGTLALLLSTTALLGFRRRRSVTGV